MRAGAGGLGKPVKGSRGMAGGFGWVGNGLIWVLVVWVPGRVFRGGWRHRLSCSVILKDAPGA